MLELAEVPFGSDPLPNRVQSPQFGVESHQVQGV